MSVFEELKQKHGSQYKAAAAVGVSRSVFCAWINGQKTPRPKNILRLEEMGFAPKDIYESIYSRPEIR